MLRYKRGLPHFITTMAHGYFDIYHVFQILRKANNRKYEGYLEALVQNIYFYYYFFFQFSKELQNCHQITRQNSGHMCRI